MNLHYFQHVPFEDLGRIRDWATGNGHEITRTRFFANESPPPPEDIECLVIMGGPMSVYEENRYPWLSLEKRAIEQALKADKTILGICLGAQFLADVLGAKVYPNAHKEIGWFPVKKVPTASDSSLFESFPREVEAFHWHNDTFDIPTGCTHIAKSDCCEHQAFVYGDRAVALQFHLETTRTSAARLIHNCADEEHDGPFVQTGTSMLSDEGRFKRINNTMCALMDELATRASVHQSIRPRHIGDEKRPRRVRKDTTHDPRI